MTESKEEPTSVQVNVRLDEAILNQFINGLERVSTLRDHERAEERSSLKFMSRIVKAALSGQRG